MRYGIISDVHGNMAALRRVLDYLDDQGVEKCLCCGDIVGYGAHPNECCDMMRERECLCVMGNHDEAACRPEKDRWFTASARACIEWTRQVLTSENIEFLSELPRMASIEEIQICHGSLPDPDAYVYDPYTAALTFDAMAGRICFFGHTHCTSWFVQDDSDTLPGRYSNPAGCDIELHSDSRYMINPGAVGQPRDGNSQAACAIYSSDEALVSIRRLGYDVEAAQSAIVNAGLPREMASRLSVGA
ncbi:MAG: metallophosphoesterase family protein [Armatimonadota bacterium]